MKKEVVIALAIGTVSAVSMNYLFNYGRGTNTRLATTGGAITGLSYLAAKTFKVI